MVSPNPGHLEVSNEAHSAPHSHVENESNSSIIGSHAELAARDAELAARDAELAARDAVIKSIVIKLALE
jgi:hypothetical protein